jgi:hypothetical protein
MEENGFKGQRDELHTRITAIRDKAVQLPLNSVICLVNC